MKRISLRSRAHADLTEAIDYYAAEAPRAAPRLVSSFDETFRRIRRNPNIGSPRFGQELRLPGLRHVAVRRFPYLIFCFVEPEVVVVVRVLHAKSDVLAALSGD